MDSKPTEGFEKLQFLLQQNPFPPETFGNLLLLYCKYEYYDLAADVLAENAHLTYKYLSPHLYDFLEALITQQTSPDEAYRKFDAIASKHTEQLRKYTKQVQVKTFLNLLFCLYLGSFSFGSVCVRSAVRHLQRNLYHHFD